MSDYRVKLKYLTEGSVWIDSAMRTVIVWRIHWANAVNVASFDLLAIPEMKIRNFPAREVEQYVRSGEMQFCKECERA